MLSAYSKSKVDLLVKDHYQLIKTLFLVVDLMRFNEIEDSEQP